MPNSAQPNKPKPKSSSQRKKLMEKDSQPAEPQTAQPVKNLSSQVKRMERDGQESEEEGHMETDIRGERRNRAEDEDPSQMPRNKYRKSPVTPSSPEHTDLSGMLAGDSFMDSLLETMSPHTEPM
ncbi:hypothetical protein DPMN_136844 [Dreissena polymorpha]|uniref:Uncharacterized protein n=1 Tax=Dreissena polymorpha TaxID=45954 RepID=A0A9D4JH42_DREPO|nr:hypothetical protein DPMN_136844 [Dreissena polymorpha]